MQNKNIDSLVRQGSPVEKRSPKRVLKKQYLYVGGIFILAALLMTILYALSRKRSSLLTSAKTSQQPLAVVSESPQSDPANTSDGGTIKSDAATLPEYKLIEPAASSQSNNQASTGAVRYTVITLERNTDKLIALNDLLLNQLKDKIDPKRGFFIDYFDNQSIAASYFTQVADKNVSKVQRDELYNHYVALMVRSDTLKMNQLYAQGKNAKVIKQY